MLIPSNSDLRRSPGPVPVPDDYEEVNLPMKTQCHPGAGRNFKVKDNLPVNHYGRGHPLIRAQFNGCAPTCKHDRPAQSHVRDCHESRTPPLYLITNNFFPPHFMSRFITASALRLSARTL
eukprot:2422497-Rhodomonas_salina.2